MKILDDAAFLTLDWSDTLAARMRDQMLRDEVVALTAHRRQGRLVGQAWSQWPETWPHDTIAIWRRPVTAASRTMEGLRLVEQGLTVYAAAKAVGIRAQTLHAALKRRAHRDVCPTCGQVLPRSA